MAATQDALMALPQRRPGTAHGLHIIAANVRPAPSESPPAHISASQYERLDRSARSAWIPVYWGWQRTSIMPAYELRIAVAKEDLGIYLRSVVPEGGAHTFGCGTRFRYDHAEDRILVTRIDPPEHSCRPHN